MHFISTEKIKEVKKNFLQESGIQFSELEEKVLQFHLSNLEFACGSTLDQVWETHTLNSCKSLFYNVKRQLLPYFKMF